MLPSFRLLGPFIDDKGFLKTYVPKDRRGRENKSQLAFYLRQQFQ
jgi:hypothetical protein